MTNSCKGVFLSMRIAYIAEWPVEPDTGVFKKIRMQIKIWCEQGHEAVLFLVSPLTKKGFKLNNNNFLLFQWYPSKYLPALKFYISKIMLTNKLKKFLVSFRPDIIYYRQGIWYPGLISVLNVSPYVVEVNTKDTDEIKLFGIIKTAYHHLTRNFILKNASGIIGVTEEITDNLKKFKKPLLSITNGIDLKRIQPRRPPKNMRPQLVFVGHPGFPWHGVDKVKILAKEVPEFDFHIVGPDVDLSDDSPNLYQHGYLGENDLKKIYENIDCGIGTLALYRKKMNMACPLKVREYLAYGLPVIIAYRDPDLMKCNYVLEIPNHSNSVKENVDKIHKFVLYWMGKEIDMNDVYKRIDMRVKEKKRLEFMESLLVKN